MSYHQISRSLEVARLGVQIVVSLWNLTGGSATLRWYFSQSYNCNHISRDFETLRELVVKRLTDQWIEGQGIPNRQVDHFQAIFGIFKENLPVKEHTIHAAWIIIVQPILWWHICTHTIIILIFERRVLIFPKCANLLVITYIYTVKDNFGHGVNL